MENQGPYTLTEMTKWAIHYYNLETDDETVDTQTTDNLKKKIERVCKKLPMPSEGQEKTLWQTSKARSPKGTQHIFTMSDRQRIFATPEMLQYLQGLTATKGNDKAADSIAKKLEIMRKIDKAETAKEEYDPSDLSINTVCLVSSEELRAKKLEIMIEALFLEHFMPVDMEQLECDMELLRLADQREDDEDMFSALERLNNPQKSYVQKKTDE